MEGEEGAEMGGTRPEGFVVANYRTFQVISSWPDGGAVVRHARVQHVVRRNQGDQEAPTDFRDPKFNSNFDVEI